MRIPRMVSATRPMARSSYARVAAEDHPGWSCIAFLLLALFAEMEHIFTAERAAHPRAVAAARDRRIGRPWPTPTAV
jgi:hypothetical protein